MPENIIPKQYEWVAKEGAPKMIVEALKLYGTSEDLSKKSNPTILEWAKEVGGDVDDIYNSDAIPWCGLFMAVVAKRAGKQLPDKPLWALNWANFGNPIAIPEFGDVLTFKRSQGGHVALYIGEDAAAYHVLGGNQADKVCFTRIGKERLYKARRPIYSTAQPSNVRRIYLSQIGAISLNEK